MYSIIVASLLCFACFADGITINSCEGLGDKFPDSIDPVGCQGSKLYSEQYCVVIKGESVTMVMNFTLAADVEKLIAVVDGIIMEVDVPFLLPYKNACEDPDSTINCPLKKGGSYRYMATLPVHVKYPSLALTVKWKLQDQDGNPIACALIPVKIQNYNDP